MEDLDNQNINIKEEVLKYISHWRWFVVGVFITIVCSFLYLRYATKIYQSNTTVLIKEDSGNDLSNQLSAFSDGGLFNTKNKIENEIEIFKSRSLNEMVIDSLKIHNEVWAKGTIRQAYLYKENPFVIEFTSNVSEEDQKNVSFELINNGQTYDLKNDDYSFANIKYGQKISLDEGELVIYKNANDTADQKDFLINIRPKISVSDSFRAGLNVSQTNQRSNVLSLSLNHPNAQLAADYLNTLVYFYNEQSVNDKRFISEHTSEFISNRLNIIAEELGDVERDVERYKSTNNIADVQAEVQSFINNLSAFERSHIENETKINITKELINFVSRSDIDELVPNGVMGSDGGSEAIINEINALILEKEKLAISSTPENPNYIALESQIKNLKENLKQSLRTQLNTLSIARNDLKRQEAELQSKLNQVPKQEREFRVIDRQQKVKEALYLFLLQKREETNITLAATENNAKIIDKAIPTKNPVSPKSMIVLLAAFILGILIPFAILYIKYLLDDKIKTRMDIEGKYNIPFLGDIPKSHSSNELMDHDSRSGAAEAIRIVRTNLEFLLASSSKGQAKTIFTTSTLPGEGKTFVCANIAATIAISGKKVLLMGMDLRNPKLREYLNIPSEGFTNYLMNDNKPIDDYIVNIPQYKHFDVLPSGTIPPNPVELLIDERVESTFEYLKSKYDYILVDTAPVAPVTDTLLISKYADTVIYVVRSNKIDKKLLNIPLTLHAENKLPKMAFLLNDTDTTKGYGYGYGYGVNKEEAKIPLWKKILGIK